MEGSDYFMPVGGDRQGEGQGTKCHAGNETEAGEAGEDGRC